MSVQHKPRTVTDADARKGLSAKAACCLAMAFTMLLVTGSPAAGQQVSSTQTAGGGGGRNFTDVLPSAEARIVEVRIRSGDALDAIQVIYTLPNGQTVAGSRHGGSGGRESVFRLDADEYIIGLSGRYGDTIDSLRIHTNKRVSEAFGGRGGDRDYRIEVPPGNQAAGITGRSGDLLDAVGLTYTPLGTSGRLGIFSGSRRRPIPSGQSPNSGTWPAGQGVQSQALPTSIAGGRGGDAFADGGIPQNARISAIRVRASYRIESLQAVYLLSNGQSVEGTRHGGSGGRETVFQLQPDEYIVALSGRYGDTIDSLRIHTNRRTSALFGGSGGDREYRVEVPAGNQAVGFSGRAGSALDAVGLVYSAVARNRTYPLWPRRP